MKQQRKNDYKGRESKVEVRFFPAEKAQLQLLAAEAGMTISDFIRVRTISAKRIIKKATPLREVLIKLLAELGKIGSNVNQMARALNRRQDSEELKGISFDEINNVIADVGKATDKLIKELNRGY